MEFNSNTAAIRLNMVDGTGACQRGYAYCV